MIRELKKEDIDRINDSFINKEYLIKEWDNNPFAKVILLEENHEIIGYLYYSDIYDRIEINQIEISFIHRNCGKGNIILSYLTEHTDKGITLEVRIDNIPAIKLYEKNGFERKAIRKGYYNGIDGILMERK